MLVKEFITEDPATTREGASVSDTRDLMEGKNFRIIFVLDDEDRLSGFLTYDSIKNKPEDKEIDPFVSRSTLHARVDDTIDKAVSIIKEYGLMVLPVVDGERKLVGVLTPGRLFEKFSELLNFGEGGFWLTLHYEETSDFNDYLSVIQDQDVEILSLLNSSQGEKKKMIVKIGKVENSDELKKSLEQVMSDE